MKDCAIKSNEKLFREELKCNCSLELSTFDTQLLCKVFLRIELYNIN